MEAHDQIVHELLDIGETLLTSGAEINRVEDTMTRLGRAYGAERVDIFVITSDIVLTVRFLSGEELTHEAARTRGKQKRPAQKSIPNARLPRGFRKSIRRSRR